MFIPLTEKMPELTEEQKEKMNWDNWVWNSHKWIEKERGYYTCDFCGNMTTNLMSLGSVGLCKKNPEIIKHNNR